MEPVKLTDEDGRPPLPPVKPCIDFHFHSYYSNDAFGDPAEYVALAETRGVAAIAPTEHDNLDSLPVYRAAIEKFRAPLKLYSGVEIDVASARWGHQHILAYFLPTCAPYHCLEQLWKAYDRRHGRAPQTLTSAN